MFFYIPKSWRAWRAPSWGKRRGGGYVYKLEVQVHSETVVLCKAWLQAVKPRMPSPESLSRAGPCWRLYRAQGSACTWQSPGPGSEAVALKMMCMTVISCANLQSHDHQQWRQTRRLHNFSAHHKSIIKLFFIHFLGSDLLQQHPAAPVRTTSVAQRTWQQLRWVFVLFIVLHTLTLFISESFSSQLEVLNETTSTQHDPSKAHVEQAGCQYSGLP